MKHNDIEALRQLLDNGKVWIASGKILQLDLLEDRSFWRAKIQVLPYNYEVIARMTWSSAGPDSGIFGPAQAGDLVLLAFDPELQEAFVISRLSSKEDTIPQQACDGHTVVKSLPGKNVYLASDTKIFLSKLTNVDPDEPIMLGKTMKALLSYILGQLSSQAEKIALHKHVGNLGAPTSIPDNATDFTTIKGNFDTKKSSPVDDNLINSDIAFVEK